MTDGTVSTSDRILDAFERVVIQHGERAATLSAVAEEAGVSKGGLLYHFGSKTAMVDGLIERLRSLAQAEEARFELEQDVVATFLRESVAAELPIDRTMIALVRLGQLDEHPNARQAFLECDRYYQPMLERALGDPDLALLVLRLSDGIYLRSALSGHDADSKDALDRMIGSLGGLLEARGSGKPTSD